MEPLKGHIHHSQRIKKIEPEVNGSVCNSNADIPEVRIIGAKAVQQERGLSHCTPRIQ